MYIDISGYKTLIEAINGINESQLKHIEGESSYNYNFYFFVHKFVHYKLLAESDDEDSTIWYWVCGDALLLIGHSGLDGEIFASEKFHT